MASPVDKTAVTLEDCKTAQARIARRSLYAVGSEWPGKRPDGIAGFLKA